MGKIEENILEIRNHFMELQNEKYTIHNGRLSDKEEYLKSLYVQMLSTVVQYENDVTEMQLLFLQRIVKGLCCELKTEDYMRKALDISMVEVKEFADAYQSEEGRYYFALNGMILSALGERDDSNYDYLAELIQMLGIHITELRYLSKVAESVLMQSSEIFDEAKKMMTEELGFLDLTDYIRNFYAGAVVDSKSVVIYSAPEKQVVHSLETGGMEFYQRKVVFANIEINVAGEWQFHGCEEVRFENCTINGNGGYLYLQGVGSFQMEGCKVRKFANSFAHLESVGNVLVVSSAFNECGREEGRREKIVGGGVFCYKGEGESVVFDGNYIQNVYIKNTSAYGTASGAFFGLKSSEGNMCLKKIEVKNNIFTGGTCISAENAWYRDLECLIFYRKAQGVSEKNNTVKGGITRIIAKG